MSFNENNYSITHLLGNTNVPRNLLPTLRSTKRRKDPDGGSSVPYFTNTNGKTLRLLYTREVSTVVTDTQVDIAFASNSYQAIIATINAVDVSNLEAIDGDGFLIIRNKNPGKTHRLEIRPWTTPANDAAPVFGFRVTPFPGSISYAGEISSSPGIRTEENPQGTTLVGKDEDFNSPALNRPSATLLQKIQDLTNELERDVVVYREVSATLQNHPISGTRPCFVLNNSNLRLPIEVMGMAGRTSGMSGSFSGRLDPFFTLLGHDGGGGFVNSELAKDDAFEPIPATALGAFYATTSTAFDDSQSFAAWGTPDGRSIYGPTVPNKNKHAPVTITSFDGNIAYCAGATFQTNLIKKNDPVQISNPVTTAPFDHSGWFAVEKVISQTHLALRPLSPSERSPTVLNRPRSINPAGLGTLRVAMGYFIPATNVWIRVDVDNVFAVKLRVAVAVPLREALAEDFALGRSGTFQGLGSVVQDHMFGSEDRHTAAQISSFVPSETWAGSDTVEGDNLEEMINDIIADLAATTGSGGTACIGGGELNLGGSTFPILVPAGTLESQLFSLLQQIRENVNYGGPAAWADGSTIGILHLLDVVNKIVGDLSSFDVDDDTTDDGSTKIGVDYLEDADGNGQWNGGTLRSVLAHLARGGSSHAGMYYLQGFDFALEGDGTIDIGAGGISITTTDVLLAYNLAKLVPVPPTFSSRGYFFSGGVIRFQVKVAQTVEVTCHLVHARNTGDPDTPPTPDTDIDEFFTGTYTAGFHEIDLIPAAGRYLRTYSPIPANLVLFFQVISGDGCVFLNADIKIEYGIPS